MILWTLDRIQRRPRYGIVGKLTLFCSLSLICSDTPEPAIMGVSRIWVLSSHRKKGVGTHLLEIARYD